MKTTIFSILAMAMIAVLLANVPGVLNTATGDDEHWEFWENRGHKRSLVPANPVYTEECGSCHVAYPPELLPQASWDAIMNGLADHFGDNAELDAKTAMEIYDYLYNNSAERSGYGNMARMARSARGAPMRITELPFFKRQHGEISPRIINLPEVKSMSNCDACHREAAQGLFDEGNVEIKGRGRWYD
jgi:hypothetical protein